jgi:hypothetical protein
MEFLEFSLIFPNQARMSHEFEYARTQEDCAYGSNDCGNPDNMSEDTMLEQIWCMMSPRGGNVGYYSKGDLVLSLVEHVEHYRALRQFHNTQILFQNIVNNIDILLAAGVQDGEFIYRIKK